MFHEKGYRWALLALSLFLVLISVQSRPAKDSRPENDLDPVSEAYELILNRYYLPEDLDKEELIQGAIEGMLNQLPDDYNSVYTKKEYEDYRKRQEGNYVGIGMEIEKSGNYVRVIATFPDTPASRSSISARDLIIGVDGKSTKDMTFNEVYDALSGEKGTNVTLTVRHPDGTEESIDLVREKITITPVELSLVEDQKIVLIDINLFNLKTADELKRKLGRSNLEGVNGYIVDLRDNPGGWLSSAINVASQFVDSGLITKTVGRDGERKFNSRGNSNPNLPLAVLVNDGTASASEIVAGAIRDQGMGIIVGRKSFGKGLVQTTHTIGRTFKVKLSTAEYLTPAGNSLHGKGLAPDINSETRGEDLEKAINWIEDHQGRLMPLGKNKG